MSRPGFVYIMASRRNGTIYIGVTSDLPGRVYQHRNGLIDGFTRKYGCRILVWYEAHDDIQDARRRELQMKRWKRQWKLDEIEAMNRIGTTSSSRCFEDRAPAFLCPCEGRGPARARVCSGKERRVIEAMNPDGDDSYDQLF